MSDPYAPDPTTDALLQYLLGGGQQAGGYLGAATPTLSMGQFNSMAGMIPQDKDQLTQNAKAANYAQDLMSMQADPMVLAYGGAGGFDPTAFQPLVSTSMYDSPELAAFNTYLANPNSFRGSVAQILKEGGDPSTLIADLQQLLGFDPLDYTDPELNPIARELPWMQDQRTGRPTQIDWMGVQDEISKITGEFSAIPQAGPMGQQVSDDGTVISEGGERTWTYDDAGRLIVAEQTSKPSPMTEEFRRLGLPSPMEEFTSDYILGPDQVAMQDAYQQLLGQLDVARQGLGDESLRPSMDWQREGPAGVPAAPGWGGPGAQAQAIQQPQDQGDGGYQGLPSRVGGFNIPWMGGGLGDQHVPLPGAPGAVGQMTDAMRAAILNTPWAIDVTANQMVPGLPLNTDAAGAVVEAGERNNAINTAANVANNPAAAAVNVLQGGWNWLFPQQEAEAAAPPEEGGGAGTRVQKPAAYGMMRKQGTGEEPVPPPTDLTWAGGPTEWFGGGRETPPPQPGAPLDLAQALTGQQQYAYPDRQSWELAQGRTPPTPPGSETAPWGTTPDQPSDQAMIDYILSSVLPNYPATAAAREQQAQAVHEGNRIRTLAQMRQQDTEPRYQFPGGGHMAGAATGERVRATEPVGIENEQYGPRYQFPFDASGERARWVTEATGPPQSERATHRGDVSDQAMIDYMLSSILPNYPTTTGARDQQSQAVHEGNRVRTLAQLRQQDTEPRYQFPGGGHMYGQATGLPSMRTGEERRQAESDRESELAGETVLGGSTNRTGKRVRATRSPEQARRYRQANQQFRSLWLQAQQARQQTYGYDQGYAAGMAMRMREQGITPTTAALSARQLPIAAMGITSPGQYGR